MALRIRGLDTGWVDTMRVGEPDANEQLPLARPAEPANPCRHCLQLIALGDTKLVLAHRPFASLQPYAETGPIFLHAAACTRYDSDVLPPWFAFLDPAIVRGYDTQDWIRYDTGAAVPGAELAATCETILEDASIAYVHIRSKFGCFQCRVDRS